jgi:hypothetical protein
MNKLTQKFLAVSLLALAGCEGEANSGRLVGFIVDGQTGQRLNFFKAESDKNNLGADGDSKSQVYAIVDGEFRRAEPCGRGDLNSKNGIEADGCYQIKNIPEGMTIPIFAQAEGYERFVGEYTYSELNSDIEHSQEVANIRLFPKNFAVDYRFNVSFNNQPVPKAQIICQYLPTSSNTLQIAGDFLNPVNTGTTSITATSGDDGVAVIQGTQLVNGASYHCEAVLSQSMDGRTLAGQDNIVAGVTQPERIVSLSASGATDTFLYAVRSNADDSNALLGADGKLVINFNRPVELIPGTGNCRVATSFISSPTGTTGSLIVSSDVPGSDTSENVTVETSPDGLTMTIGFRAQDSFQSDDRGTTVSFSGIYVRPRGSTGRQIRYIGGAGTCPEVEGYTPSTLSSQRLTFLNGGFTTAQPGTIRLF